MQIERASTPFILEKETENIWLPFVGNLRLNFIYNRKLHLMENYEKAQLSIFL